MEITADSPWWYGLICLYGLEGVHWEYFDNDLDWWAVHFILLDNQN